MPRAGLNRTKPLYYQAFLSDDIADLARVYDYDINICIVERQGNEMVNEFIVHLLSRSNAINFVENIEFANFNFFSLMPDAGIFRVIGIFARMSLFWSACIATCSI